MPRLNAILILLGLGFSIPALAQPEEPRATFVFEIRAAIDPAITLGQTRDGVRRSIPITGGSFEGPDIRGDIIPGGADYQLDRPDGVTEVVAIYEIRTDDGAVIHVENRGIISPTDDGAAYIRTSPRFWAPEGPYAWLNTHLFLGTLRVDSAAPGYVFIRVYRVD